MFDTNDISELAKIVYESFPDYTLVKVEDYEDDTRQSYKFLYEKVCAKLAQGQNKIEELEAELFAQNSNIDMQAREISELSSEIERLRTINDSLQNGTSEFAKVIDKIVSEDIIISSPVPVSSDGNEIVKGSDLREAAELEYTSTPAVYEYRRPSFFSPLGPELNKENAALKMARKTFPLLEQKTSFWDKLLAHASKEPRNADQFAEQADRKRSEEINKLLKSTISNEEKYIKYLMLTPGIKRDYFGTLMGAADLALDANSVIRLLEQPAELFNKEIFEAYVSRVHKGTEYNLKRELAEELIRDEWSIRATVNGTEQLFRLTPYDFLCDLKETLVTIGNMLSGNLEQSTGAENFAVEPCAKLAQGSTVGEEISFEDQVSQLPVEFDDTMIDMMF